ncbi:MAG TPA: thioredoxin-like domain-containing protein [Pirellulales bacterium]|jgi:thiol-disulfide isomerase/thioredoxin|nr:thioredoxin-like domain-containing protein [Pirellulales bacterium]
MSRFSLVRGTGWFLSLAAGSCLTLTSWSQAANPAQKADVKKSDSVKKTDADKKADPDKKADADKKGDSDKKGTEADDPIQHQIQHLRELAFNDADLDQYKTEKEKFLAEHPNDPARWDLTLLDARIPFRSIKSQAAFKAQIKKSKVLIEEILAAKDAKPDVRSAASMMNIQFVMEDGSEDDLVNAVTEHLKNFSDAQQNERLAQMVVQTVGRKAPDKALPVIEKLAKSDVAVLASAAEKKLAQIKTVLELAEKPVDLKFTAVDGREVDFTKLKGKVVLVDFWATWCGPCVASLPEVKELYKKYHDDGLEIVGISFDQEKDKLTKFVDLKEMPWPQYFDGKAWQNELGQKYGISAIPVMWLIGKDGKVIDFEARTNLADKLAKIMKE